ILVASIGCMLELADAGISVTVPARGPLWYAMRVKFDLSTVTVAWTVAVFRSVSTVFVTVASYRSIASYRVCTCSPTDSASDIEPLGTPMHPARRITSPMKRARGT
ncbi:hypothetical protein, partial [Haloferax profundi]|uniref:hypothetical protein n=1 Tax=Haloferax profundi TaxID=1544718 RepID=UPI001E356E93